jgi:hypothetical protein
VSGQLHAPVALLPGKEHPYSLKRKLEASLSQSTCTGEQMYLLAFRKQNHEYSGVQLKV